MKKITSSVIAIVLCMATVLSVVGCGKNKLSKAAQNAIKDKTFYTNLSIDKKVLHDENGIKIEADHIIEARSEKGMCLYLKCYNNTEQKLLFVGGGMPDSSNYTTLTVNGQKFKEWDAASDSFTHVDPGDSGEMEIYISKEEAEEKEIYVVETIELCIGAGDEDFKKADYFYPLTIKVKAK